MQIQELISEIEEKLARLKAIAGGAAVEDAEELEESPEEEAEMTEVKPNEADPAGGIEKKLKKAAFLNAMKKGV